MKKKLQTNSIEFNTSFHWAWALQCNNNTNTLPQYHHPSLTPNHFYHVHNFSCAICIQIVYTLHITIILNEWKWWIIFSLRTSGQHIYNKRLTKPSEHHHTICCKLMRTFVIRFKRWEMVFFSCIFPYILFYSIRLSVVSFSSTTWKKCLWYMKTCVHSAVANVTALDMQQWCCSVDGLSETSKDSAA